MHILSIQSWVAYGHVGNAAAVFPLQRLGAEVSAINTVEFSNHPGYGAVTGEVVPASRVKALLDGLDDRGALNHCDALLSGYLGEAATGDVVLEGVARLKAANHTAVWCCDPVIGDEGPGIYVRPGIADFFREQAVPAADLLTPNHFELQLLTGLACTTMAETKIALRRDPASCWSPACAAKTRRRTASTAWWAVRRALPDCGPQGCRSQPMAQVMPWRRCSCSTSWLGNRRPQPWKMRRPPFTVC